VNAELVVGVLQVLADRLRGDLQLPGNLGIRLALGNAIENLPFAGREPMRDVRDAPTHTSPYCLATELPQVREQEVEHSPVALFEVGTGAIELQPRLSVAAGTEPQTHHVFDAYRAGRMLIQLEPVKLALG
jgi:hypothetical protein